jgi:hypothetical protein
MQDCNNGTTENPSFTITFSILTIDERPAGEAVYEARFAPHKNVPASGRASLD